MRDKRLAVIIACAGLSALAALSWVFWDQGFLAWQSQHLSDFKKPLPAVALGQLGKGWLLVWLLLCWALLAKCRREASIALIALFLVIFTVQPLKTATHRPRPRDAIEADSSPDSARYLLRSWSFPSGDTASAFAVAAAISPFLGWLGRGAVFALAGGVGMLRLLSFSHYLSDVFAGAAAGVLASYLAYWLVLSRPRLSRTLVEVLVPQIVWPAVVIIPLVVGVFKGLDGLLVFCMFYPPVIAAVCLLRRLDRRSAVSSAAPDVPA